MPNNSTTQTVNGITYTINEDKSITISGTATARADIYLFGGSSDTGNYLHIPRGSYVLNDRNKLTNGSLFLAFREKTAGTKYETTTSDTAMELLANQDCYFYGVMLAVENGVTLNQMTFYPMVSNETTTYEPYITPITKQLSLGEYELYEDSYIERVSEGNYNLVSAYEKKRINVNPNTIDTASTNTTRLLFANVMNNPCKYTTLNKCNMLSFKSNWLIDEEGFYNDENTRNIVIRINKSIIGTTLNEVSNYLQNNNLYVVCKLVTPIITPITNTTLINQLEEWYNSHSFTGTTIIKIDGQLPLIIKARALKAS